MKISKKNLKYMFLVLAYFEPEFISYFENLASLGYVLSAIRLIITIYVSYKYIVEKKSSKIVRMVVIFEAAMIIASYFNGTLYLTYVLSSITCIGFVVLSERLLTESKMSYFKALINLFSIYSILNFIIMIYYPNGLVEGRQGDAAIFFLGTKNNFITIFLPLMCFALCYSYMKNKKIGSITYVLLIFITFLIIISNSVTSTICAMLLWIYIICFNNKIYTYFFNAKTYVYLILVLFISFVLLQTHNPLVSVITNLFHREITFSGRTAIWNLAIEYFKEEPIWGKGIGISFNAWENGALVYSAHNYILELACKYGVFPVIIYIYICWLIVKRLYLKKSDTIVRIISFSLFIFFIMSLFEAYGSIVRLLFIIVPYIISKNENYNCSSIKNKS